MRGFTPSHTTGTVRNKRVRICFMLASHHKSWSGVSSRHQRQSDSAGVCAVVIDRDLRLHKIGTRGRVLPRVQVAVEAGKVAAGDFKPDFVAFEKDDAGGPHVDLVLVNLARFERL